MACMANAKSALLHDVQARTWQIAQAAARVAAGNCTARVQVLGFEPLTSTAHLLYFVIFDTAPCLDVVYIRTSGKVHKADLNVLIVLISSHLIPSIGTHDCQMLSPSW